MAAEIPPAPGPLGDGRLQTVLIFARDFGGMLRFYRDVLGLRVGYSNDNFAELTAGAGARIALHGGVELPPSLDGDVMVEFTVADIEACVAELTLRGVKVDSIRTEPFGKIAHLWDPEGHPIGLEQPQS